MEIAFNEAVKTFHLYNDQISYIMQVLPNGQMGQLYFGKKVHDREDFSYLLETLPRPMSSCVFTDSKSFSLDHIRQEYPSYGTGDYRMPAVEVLQENGSRIINFVYKGHRIISGKPKQKTKLKGSLSISLIFLCARIKHFFIILPPTTLKRHFQDYLFL